jgi:c(7)-type cytochrome triheme protein
MDCHQVIATEKPAIQPLREYWTNGEPIPWVRVNPQPEFVYFSHQVHILASINCETCHGNVAQMDVIRPVERMDMGWCLNCHLKQPEEKVSRLTDCVTCHK